MMMMIPETNCVPREYSVVAILLLLFTVLISLVSVLNLLYSYTSTFRSMCAVPNMAVFCSSLTSCFPGMLLTYFLNVIIITIIIAIISEFVSCSALYKNMGNLISSSIKATDYLISSIFALSPRKTLCHEVICRSQGKNGYLKFGYVLIKPHPRKLHATL